MSFFRLFFLLWACCSEIRADSLNDQFLITQINERVNQFKDNYSLKSLKLTLEMLKNEIKILYGVEIDVEQCIQSVASILRSENYNETIIDQSIVFYNQIFNEKTLYLNIGNLHLLSDAHNKDCELSLPDHFAVGYTMLLSGALLMIVPAPLAQNLGATLIGSGLCEISEGMINGEKPFYENKIEDSISFFDSIFEFSP